jgi:hypothetical protein
MARHAPKAAFLAFMETQMKRSIAAVIADTDCHVLAYNALHNSVSRFEVQQVIVFSDRPEAWPGYPVITIPKLRSVAEYNALIVKRLAEELRCDHALVMQFDGFILNPDRWAPLFQEYDYIGAPWPHHTGHNVGNGGFSLRSRKLVEAVAAMDYPDLTEPEDLHICRHLRPTLEARHGVRFATPEIASHFSFEYPHAPWPTFGFHGVFHLADVYRNAPEFLINNLSDRLIQSRVDWLLPGIRRVHPSMEAVYLARLQSLRQVAAEAN